MSPSKSLSPISLVFFLYFISYPSQSLSRGGDGLKELARNEHFIVGRIQSTESLEELAENYLGGSHQAWQIREINNINKAIPGQIIAIPLSPINSSSVYQNGYRTIPVLCYHQFSRGRKASNQLAISEFDFQEQMAYLNDNNYQVITLKELERIIKLKLGIAPKTVVITIDDGYRSIYDVAYPILKKYNLPATIFLYTDFAGGSVALSWPQVKELMEDPLIDIQSHTKTHGSLARLPEDKTERAYQNRINQEISGAEYALKKNLGLESRYFAYPYGDSSSYAVSTLKKAGYSLAFTVQRGGNSVFADPLLLRRTMIYNDHNLEDFKSFINGFETKQLP